MSVQRDYILRLIEQFGQFWAAVVALSRAGQHRDALALAERTRREAFGFDTALLDRLSPDELIGLLRLGHAPQLGQSWLTDRFTLLGLLLRAEAEVYRGLGDPARAADREEKSLALSLAALADDAAASPQAAETIEALVPGVKDRGIAPDLAYQLWHHDERAGRFSRAEDWLFAILDDDRASPELHAEALAFYQRLAALDDATLLRGDLPRNEVGAGLAELQARIAAAQDAQG